MKADIIKVEEVKDGDLVVHLGKTREVVKSYESELQQGCFVMVFKDETLFARFAIGDIIAVLEK